MNRHPRSLYSPSPPCGYATRTSTVISDRNQHETASNDEQQTEEHRKKDEITRNEDSKESESRQSDEKHWQNTNEAQHRANPRRKRHSEPAPKSSLQRFRETMLEQSQRRSRVRKRRHSDITDIKSTRVRLNEYETDRSRSPTNKRRRTSDVSDLFAMEPHAQYKVQAIGKIYDEAHIRKANLLSFLRSKPKIIEIQSTETIVVALAESGLAAVFDRRDLRFLCYLNESKEEEIRSFFFNAKTESLVIISIQYQAQNRNVETEGNEEAERVMQEELQCKVVRVRDILFGRNHSKRIFETEKINNPGFLEYDDVRNRVLTYNHQTHVYKVWDLNNYAMIYQFENESRSQEESANELDSYRLMEDVKLSSESLIQNIPQTIVSKHDQNQNQNDNHNHNHNHSEAANRATLQCRKRIIVLRSLDEDKIINRFEIEMHDDYEKHTNESQAGEQDEDEEEAKNAKKEMEGYDFMEYHHGYLYVKESEKQPLKVYDCRNRQKRPKILHEFELPSAYLFLKRFNRLLFYKKCAVRVDAQSERDDELMHRGVYSVLDLVSGQRIELKQHVKNASHRDSVMFITPDQTKIIYYSKFRNARRRNKREGIIQINSLENGQLFGWIRCNEQMMKRRTSVSNRWCLSAAQNEKRTHLEVHRNPLKGITALNYNMKHNEIYTGNKNGDILIWA